MNDGPLKDARCQLIDAENALPHIPKLNVIDFNVFSEYPSAIDHSTVPRTPRPPV
jgi:hypothetical protein